jgi:hypothetical protein
MQPPSPFALKIVSGGQTGADLAALDWAIAHDVPHGGWCPNGRRAENGPIPDHYQLQETATDDYPERTERNVVESDATVVFTPRRALEGGSKLTFDLASRHRRPVLHLFPGSAHPGRRLAAFVREHGVRVLNVAGTRASRAPTIGTYVMRTLDEAWAELNPNPSARDSRSWTIPTSPESSHG